MADPIIGKISVGDGATFTPSINGDVLSWSNNKNLPNPESKDIVGATFTPDVDEDGVLSWTNNKGLPNPDSVDLAQAVVDKKPGWGIPIGYEYFSFNPNIPQGALPLFGGEYSRTTYSDLWAWVQTQTGYLKTEAEWQTLSTSNNGNVPYYSDGDGSTTFRVPSLKCWIKAANGTVTEVGSYLEAGMPNITGSFAVYIPRSATPAVSNSGFSEGDGAFLRSTPAVTKYYSPAGDTTGNTDTRMTIDASRSSSIYGNSTTVQPESIVGLWLVQAYGVVVDTGQIDEQQYIDDRIAALPTSLSTTFLPLAGGTMTGNIALNGAKIVNSADNTYITVCGGTDDGGSYLRIHGKNSTYAGLFGLRADNGVNNCTLLGNANGSLTWNGKEVERVNASGTGYIRFESGLQIVWSSVTGVTDAGRAVTFPAAFKDTSYIPFFSAAGYLVASNGIGYANRTTTGMTINRGTSTGATVNYMCIGYWK